MYYFEADDGVSGFEIWKTDGTEAGTVMVRDIAAVWGSNPDNFTPFNGEVYFRADDGINGNELWKTDGTVNGTQMVLNINPTNTNNFPGSSSPQGFIVFNGELYFAAADGASGRELWKTNGTTQGTVMVKDINGAGADNSSYPKVTSRSSTASSISELTME